MTTLRREQSKVYFKEATREVSQFNGGNAVGGIADDRTIRSRYSEKRLAFPTKRIRSLKFIRF